MEPWISHYGASVIPRLREAELFGNGIGLKELLSGAYQPQKTPDGNICLDFQDFRQSLLFLSADCSRFSIAAFQSALGLDAVWDDGLAVPWLIARLYYSAFYAGHALLRLWGWSCSYLDSERTAELQKILQLYSVSQDTVRRGQYQLCFNNEGREVVLKELGQNGGAHDGFWKVFLERLKLVQIATPQGTSAGNQAFAFLVRLQNLMVERGQANFLSRVRNDVQYRLGHAVWFPDKPKAPWARRMRRIAGQWRDTSLDRLEFDDSDELARLVSASTAMLSLTRLLLEWLAKPSDRVSFLAKGPIRLLREHPARASKGPARSHR